MTDTKAETMSVEEVAVELGISSRAVYRWLEDGILPPPDRRYPGTRWRRSVILAWKATRVPGEYRRELPDMKAATK